MIGFPYLSKPDQFALKNSIETLKLIGAIRSEDQVITKIGRLLSKIPIDPILSRAIVQAMLYEKFIHMNPFFEGIPEFSREYLTESKKSGLKDSVIQILGMVINFSNLFLSIKNEK